MLPRVEAKAGPTGLAGLDRRVGHRPVENREDVGEDVEPCGKSLHGRDPIGRRYSRAAAATQAMAIVDADHAMARLEGRQPTKVLRPERPGWTPKQEVA